MKCTQTLVYIYLLVSISRFLVSIIGIPGCLFHMSCHRGGGHWHPTKVCWTPSSPDALGVLELVGFSDGFKG